MKYLNLTHDFQPFGISISFDAFTFNGGEPHIKIEEELTSADQVTITIRVNSFNDMGVLLVAVDALKRMGIKTINLFLPYFPGARQDRLMVTGEPLTVKVYADVFNNLQLNKITILDPHSEVAPALLNNVEIISTNHFVKEAVKHLENFYLVSPDGGALKKIYKTAQFLGGIEVVECSKTRDVKTGKLSGFKVYHEDLKGKTCVVVDDICDGGGTFIGLAEELKNKNAGDLILVVSHGIFSHGYDELLTAYKEIYTTDSFKSVNNKGIQQICLTKNLVQ